MPRRFFLGPPGQVRAQRQLIPGCVRNVLDAFKMIAAWSMLTFRNADGDEVLCYINSNGIPHDAHPLNINIGPFFR